MSTQNSTQLNLNITARFVKNASFIRTEKVKTMKLTVFCGE